MKDKLIWGMGILLVLLLCFVFFGAWEGKATETGQEKAAASTKLAGGAKMTVKVLNIGQGDSILIQTLEQTVLIDTSDVDERDKLDRELQKAGVKTIDKVILTHAHADHIGGMDVLLNPENPMHKYQVKEIFDNGVPSKSKLYSSKNKKHPGYVDLAKMNNIPLRGVQAGEVLDLGGGAKFEVLYPSKKRLEIATKSGNKPEPNNESVVGRLVFGEFTMLFTGDAEKEVEEELLQTNPAALRSTLLKAPHHGSKSSSLQAFLDATKAEAVLISYGEGNDYGHPHPGPLKNYEKAQMKMAGTVVNGTITVVTDGKGYEIQLEKGTMRTKAAEWKTDAKKEKDKDVEKEDA